MKTVSVVERGCLRIIPVAAPTDDVMPGLQWGDPSELLTPAYWAVRSGMRDDALTEIAAPAGSLAEEVTFCLLGGFGVKAELARAFFDHLKAAGIFDRACAGEEVLRGLLSEQIELNGRSVRYRYPAQRAKRIAKALPELETSRFRTADAQTLRQELLGLEGIGPKTASWIVRNWLGADTVAIIDIHVIRACQFMGVFPQNLRLPSDYDELEDKFLQLAKGIGVAPSKLDAVMWSEMRSFTPRTLALLT